VTKPFLGVALGGGGVRGAAHIGVLQVLHDAGIDIEIVSGVSAGSIIAAMYASKKDPFWIEKKIREVWESGDFGASSKKYLKYKNPKSFIAKIRKSFFDHIMLILSLHRKSVIDRIPLEVAIRSLISHSTFEELKIPLKVVATNIENGEDIIYKDGQLVDALVQSSAIPGIFNPEILDNKTIVDGGVGMPIPIPAIKDDCEFTLAIDIGLYQFERLDRLNALSIKRRSDIITSNRLKTRLALDADFVIRPNTMGMEWSDFDSADDLFLSGKVAAQDSLPDLKRKINEKQQQLKMIKE